MGPLGQPGGSSGWGEVPDRPEADRSPGSTHTGGGFTPGGRAKNGLPHGRTVDQKNSVDPVNSYRCIEPVDPTQPGTCIPCTAADEINSEMLCTSLEDCRNYCEIGDEGPIGYRCVLTVMDGKELAECEMAYHEELIEYNTLALCHGQCTGHDQNGPGWNCVATGSTEGYNQYRCEQVEQGSHQTQEECWQHCMTDSGPWMP